MAGITKARSTFTQAFQKMMTPDSGRLPKLPEVSMICVKHRWMRNRNLVQGTVIFSFNENGVARIPDQGNNRRTVEFIVAGSRGLMSVMEEAAPVVSEAPPTITVIEDKPKVKPKIEEEVVTSAAPAEEEEKPTKAPPKKSTKKAPGKKSSKK
jgi:hypothetical protein